MRINIFSRVIYFSLLLSVFSCATKEERAKDLYTTQCASCHLAPKIDDLPKSIWKDFVLPEMGARMGFHNASYSPYTGYSFSEQEMMMRSGVYTQKPTILKEEWLLLKDYIIQMAPDSLDKIPRRTLLDILPLFETNSINVDSSPGSSISFLEIEEKSGLIRMANLKGDIYTYDYTAKKTIGEESFGDPITWYSNNENTSYITFVGHLNPSEIARGKIYKVFQNTVKQICTGLHRPVNTTIHDLDNNGTNEILVSEFGHLTGALSMWKEDGNDYEKNILMGQPGIIRTVIKDMNNDKKDDIIVLSTQGNEGISILYQTSPLSFRTETVIRFSPVYGSSWFDLVDYDGDGDDDIITVHGDNADKSVVNKPYHGLRIYINNGSNNFEEKFFFPMYGATRFTSNDFDEDGDIDIALISSFPDYKNTPEFSFVFLENMDSETFNFKTYGLEDPNQGRWLLIDSNDIDNDGDKDIVLSSFSYDFTSVPSHLFKEWSASDIDIIVLENTLK